MDGWMDGWMDGRESKLDSVCTGSELFRKGSDMNRIWVRLEGKHGRF